MRLQPHFLFNSLQNISVLTQHDPATASRMLTQLGDLLRASLARDRRGRDDAGDGDCADARLPRGRGDALRRPALASTIDVGPASRRRCVPTFLLQPIVENAHPPRPRRRRPRAARPGDDQGRARATPWSLDRARQRRRRPRRSAAGRLRRRPGRDLRAPGAALPARHAFLMRPLPDGGTEVRDHAALPPRAGGDRGACRTLRVLIADDEPLIRLGIRRALEAMSGVDGRRRSAATVDDAVDGHRGRRARPGRPRRADAGRHRPRRGPAPRPRAHAAGGLRHGVRRLRRPGLRGERGRLRAQAVRSRAAPAGGRAGAGAARGAGPAGRPGRSPRRRCSRPTTARRAGRGAPPPSRRSTASSSSSAERFDLVPVDAIDWIESADNYVAAPLRRAPATCSARP